MAQRKTRHKTREGRLTATHAGEELLDKLRGIAQKLGPYPGKQTRKPHKPRSWRAGQTKHLRLRSVNDDAYWVYMTREMNEEHGVPVDPWGDEMEAING